MVRSLAANLKVHEPYVICYSDGCKIGEQGDEDNELRADSLINNDHLYE